MDGGGASGGEGCLGRFRHLRCFLLALRLSPPPRHTRECAFGKLTGEFGIVEQTNSDDALVKWDDDGRGETAPTLA